MFELASTPRAEEEEGGREEGREEGTEE